MIAFKDIAKKTKIIIEQKPCEVMECSLLFKGRGHSVIRAKIKNLIDGSIISRAFHPSDSFEEAQIMSSNVIFLYAHRGQYWFCEKDNPKKRFFLEEQKLGGKVNFLKKGEQVLTQIFKEEIIGVELPIKVALKVAQAPPGVKGDTSQSLAKKVTLETGLQVSAPIFIKEGDTVEINTETGEYVKRV